MNDTKFTPGPWELATSEFEVRSFDRKLIAGMILMEAQTYDNGREQQAANARLIAAAPEMYEALNGISSLFGPDTPFVLTKLHGLMTNGDQNKIDAVFGKIMHALAKATAA